MTQNQGTLQRLFRAPLFLVFVITLLSSIATAQLVESAGDLYFNVQVGHSQTLQMHLYNGANYSLTIKVVPPYQFQTYYNNSVIANAQKQVAPNVTYSPSYFVMPAGSRASVNITVNMPLNDTPHFAEWVGIVSAQVVSNATNPGGAEIFEGLAKEFDMVPIPSTTTTSTTTTTIPTTTSAQSAFLSSSSYLTIGIAIVLIVVIAAAYYGTRGKGKGKKTGKKPKNESIEQEVARLRREKARLEKEIKKTKKRGKRARASGKPRRTTSRSRRRRR